MQDDDINARLLMLLMIADWMLVFPSIVLRISLQFIPDLCVTKTHVFSFLYRWYKHRPTSRANIP